MADWSRRIAPRTEVSASRSCGGTRPSCLGGDVIGAKLALPIPRDDQIDASFHIPVKTQGDLVFAQLLERLLELDPPAVDLDLGLLLDGFRDVLARDGTEDLVFCPHLEPDDDRLVVDLLGQLPGGLLLLGLAAGGGVLNPASLTLRTAPSEHSQLARDQVVAAEAVGDILDLAGPADVLDVLGQHNFQAGSSSTKRGLLRAMALALLLCTTRPTNDRASWRSSSRNSRRSLSAMLSFRLIAARCSWTSGSGQASMNTFTASTPSASASSPPATGIQAGTSTGLTMSASAATRAALGAAGTRGSRSRQ